ncbi:MAG: DUF2330 domain-containing protein, partial [Planctomycetes bacterium]|nr:DUF2330 domain-containing protein [Planctomycetota bacterium]
AGYDAKVLKATDAEALTFWLAQHGYEIRPTLIQWLKPYVDKGWIVNAFKIARDPNTSAGVAIGSTAVRMSFATETPMFPYREPDDMRDSKTKRLLRLFVIGDRKVAGKLAGSAEWPGKLAWAGKLTSENGKTLAPLLKIPNYVPAEGTWLTEFEDHSSPRLGDSDLTFVAHADQTPVARPTNIVYTSRSDASGKAGFVLLALSFAGFYLIQRFRFMPKRARA